MSLKLYESESHAAGTEYWLTSRGWFVVIAIAIAALIGGQAFGAPPKATVQSIMASSDLKPMPDNSPEPMRNTFGKITGKKPPAGIEGLQKIDVPKFAFGVGLAATLIAAAIKLAVIAALAFVAIHYIRHRRGTKDEPGKDIVDSLIATFEDVATRVRSERDKRKSEAAKLESSLNKLRKGVIRVASKK